MTLKIMISFQIGMIQHSNLHILSILGAVSAHTTILFFGKKYEKITQTEMCSKNVEACSRSHQNIVTLTLSLLGVPVKGQI